MMNFIIRACFHLRLRRFSFLKSICKQGLLNRGIVIKDDVWIGTGVRVLDGVVIATGCIIGAGSVVTHSTESYGIYVGIPARKIKSRK